LSVIEDLQDIQLLTYDDANDMFDEKKAYQTCGKINKISFNSVTCDSVTKDFNIESSSFHSSNNNEQINEEYRKLYMDKCKENVKLK